VKRSDGRKVIWLKEAAMQWEHIYRNCCESADEHLMSSWGQLIESTLPERFCLVV
jgi:hypothetical protein